MKKFYFLTLLALQLACTSLTDQGDELFEKGLFVEAEQTYNAALQKDAADAGALEGLQKARVKILDVGLIEVRMLRLANNYLLAADKLEGILDKQALWKVRFNSGIAETQETETAKSKEFLLQEMGREFAAGFPERGFWLGHTHKNVLSNTGPSRELDDVNVKIAGLGKKRCDEFQKQPSVKDVFLRTFVNRYCSLFGVAWASKSQVDDPWLFSGASFTNQYAIEKLNYAGALSSQALQTELSKVFENSPYYHPLSNKTLKLQMAGTLAYADNRQSERRRKDYEVQEERKEKVMTKDAQGKMVETEVKNKVKVPKVFEYFITRHDESANILSTVTGSIAGKDYRSHFQKTTTQTSESHNESNSAADVYPEKAKLMDVSEWFNQQFKTAATSFESDLNRLWGQHFCALMNESMNDDKEAIRNWEMIERCGRIENGNQIVNTYYRTRFHLSYDELWSLLKDVKTEIRGQKRVTSTL
ncbi:MAG: hypothetical protein EOP10_20845 [Proteobacteria bacterium]|nr:MAG: hypothetical protein EOP10_20845 [Pseudomonadota bacterium]